LTWLKVLLASLGAFHDFVMHLFYDSQVAVHIANNPVFCEHTKHIEFHYHFVREKLEAGDLTFSYIPRRINRPIFSPKLWGGSNLYIYGASWA